MVLRKNSSACRRPFGIKLLYLIFTQVFKGILYISNVNSFLISNEENRPRNKKSKDIQRRHDWRAIPRCSFEHGLKIQNISFPSAINPAWPGNPCYLTFLPPQAGRATNPRKKINRMLCYYVRTALPVGGPSE